MFDIAPWDRNKRPNQPQELKPILSNNDMSHFVDRFFEGMKNELAFPASFTRQHQLNPAVDIIENEAGFKFEVELPGMKSEDVDITVHDGCLTIKGEKETSKDEEDDNFICQERYYGHYQRTFSLPQNIDEDGIKANFDDGVLVLEIPKTEDAQKQYRKIELD